MSTYSELTNQLIATTKEFAYVKALTDVQMLLTTKRILATEDIRKLYTQYKSNLTRGVHTNETI